MNSAQTRTAMRKVMADTVADQNLHHKWNYEMVRPLVPYLPPFTKDLYRVGDCSKGCQYLARWAGAPDPMQNGWDGYGNSQTMWLRLEHISEAEAEPGDFVTFGYWSGEHHAACVYSTGREMLLWSWGHQGAPQILPLWEEEQWHRGMTVTFLRLMRNDPPPPPTPDDKLRARTGFYSWVAWKLGEGPWRHKGKANRKVRPNVPRRIPLKWWKAYARFIANRRRGNKATHV